MWKNTGALSAPVGCRIRGKNQKMFSFHIQYHYLYLTYLSSFFFYYCSILFFILFFAHYDIFSISGKNRWHVAESLPGSPMIVFVNCKSGGGYGEKFLRRFKQILNPGQVFDIANTGPAVGYVVFPI